MLKYQYSLVWQSGNIKDLYNFFTVENKVSRFTISTEKYRGRIKG